jgi:hypothetical protein
MGHPSRHRTCRINGRDGECWARFWYLGATVDESAAELGFVASGATSECSVNALKSLYEFRVTQCCPVVLSGANCNGRHAVTIEKTQAIFQ